MELTRLFRGGMPRPGRIMQRAAERLSDVVATVVRHTPEGRFGKTIEGASTKFPAADRDASRKMLRGITDSGARSRPFAAHQVASIPLKDANGKVIGVGFPTVRDNGADWVGWARAEDRTADHTYYQDWTPNVHLRPTEHGGEKGHWDIPGGTSAPWEEPPSYVFAHGRPDGRSEIQVHTGRGKSSYITVDGPTFGRILNANDHFRQAIDEHSRIVLQGNCYGGVSAEGAAAELWKGGIDAELYAFRSAVELIHFQNGDLYLDASTLGGVALPGEAPLRMNPLTHHAPPSSRGGEST